MSYQQLKNVNGSLYGEAQYRGIEYDSEIPDDYVVSSPGGVSSIYHHYTKGFNGPGNNSGDIYAGQGDPYISGVYGNMYQPGNSADVKNNEGYIYIEDDDEKKISKLIPVRHLPPQSLQKISPW